MFIPGFVPKKAPLVFNGGFENAPPFVAIQTNNSAWIDGTANGASSASGGRGWHGGGLNANNTVRFDPTDKNSGNYSLKIVVADPTNSVEVRSNNVGLTYGTPAGTGFILVPSANYVLSYWLKITNAAGDSNDGAGAVVLSADSTGTNVHGYGTTLAKTNQGWTRVVVPFTTAADDRAGHIELRIYTATGAATLTGTFSFDDIVLKRA